MMMAQGSGIVTMERSERIKIYDILEVELIKSRIDDCGKVR